MNSKRQIFTTLLVGVLGILVGYSYAQPTPRKVELNQTSKVLGSVPRTLCHQLRPGKFESKLLCSTDGSKGSELMQTVAEVIYQVHPDADVVLQNAGAGRGSIRAGQVTLDVFQRIFPFKDRLVHLRISGKQLRDCLEQVFDGYATKHLAGSWPYAHGLRFQVDFNGHLGSRVNNIEFKDRKSGIWSPLGLDKELSLVTSEYLANGRDGYKVLASLDREIVTQNAGILESMISFLELNRSIEVTTVENFSTQKVISEARH